MKFAIVGVGRMGLRHLQVADSLGFEIVGIHDSSSVAMQNASAELGLHGRLAFASAREMLENARPQAVVIASTAPSHHEFVIQAVDYGVRYILCEKPMAVSLQQCDEMIAACAAKSVVLAINHQMRYMEQYTAIKSLIEVGELGDLRSMTVAASNIGIAMNASHYFEAFRYLTGEEVVSVSSWLDSDRVPNPRGEQYEDRSGQLRAVTGSGKRLYMEIGADQGHGLHVIYGCRYGQVFTDQLSGFLRITRRKPEYRDLPTTRYGMPSGEEMRQIAQADVVAPTIALWNSMLEGKSFPDGSCGRHSVAGIVAANVSGEQNGAPVRLDAVPVDRIFTWA